MLLLEQVLVLVLLPWQKALLPCSAAALGQPTSTLLRVLRDDRILAASMHTATPADLQHTSIRSSRPLNPPDLLACVGLAAIGAAWHEGRADGASSLAGPLAGPLTWASSATT
jgi:hypothetical protein